MHVYIQSTSLRNKRYGDFNLDPESDRIVPEQALLRHDTTTNECPPCWYVGPDVADIAWKVQILDSSVAWTKAQSVGSLFGYITTSQRVGKPQSKRRVQQHSGHV
jgi:hypothetical protein